MRQPLIFSQGHCEGRKDAAIESICQALWRTRREQGSPPPCVEHGDAQCAHVMCILPMVDCLKLANPCPNCGGGVVFERDGDELVSSTICAFVRAERALPRLRIKARATGEWFRHGMELEAFLARALEAGE